MSAMKSLAFLVFAVVFVHAELDPREIFSAHRAKREWFNCNPVPPQCEKGKTTCVWSDDCNKECLKASTAAKPYTSGYCCTGGWNTCYCCGAGYVQTTPSPSAFSGSITCKAPYTQIDSGIYARCAWINDTSSSAVTFAQAESGCLRTGGKVLSLDTPAKIAWVNKQKRKSPCWYGPRVEKGCNFIFTDNTNNTDSDCDGKRGFLKQDVKCYMCEALGSRPIHQAQGDGPISFCPDDGSIKDCSSQYEFEEGIARSLDQCRQHCALHTNCQAFTFAPKMASGKSNCWLYNFACDKFGTTIPMARAIFAAEGVHYYKCDSTVKTPPRSG